MIAKIRQRIIQWFWFLPDRLGDRFGDSRVFAKWTGPLWAVADRVESAVAKALCLVAGHEPVRDQCNRPEHDHCIWCKKLMPAVERR